MSTLSEIRTDAETAQELIELTYHTLGLAVPPSELKPQAVDTAFRFKIHHGIPRFPLSTRFPLFLGDVRRSSPEFFRPLPPGASLDYETVSALFHYSYAFSRVDRGPGVFWPYHRLTPSPRCLFPLELYGWLPAAPPLPAGLYHFDPLHHSLEQLRAGDWRPEVARILGGELGDCLAILFLTAVFARTVAQYRDFAYRLITQEAGHVLGNINMVASNLGCTPDVRYQFHDGATSRLLGLDGEEAAMVAVLLYAGGRSRFRTGGQESGGESAGADISPLELAFTRSERLEPAMCPLLLQVERGSRLEPTNWFVQPSSGTHGCLGPAAGSLPAPPAAVVSSDLADALYFRSSGDLTFNPVWQPLPSRAIWETLRYSVEPVAGDLDPAGGDCPVDVLVAVNHAQDLASGIYRWCPGCRALHVLETGDVRDRLRALYGQPVVNVSSAGMVCYLVSDFDRAVALFGNRGYRMLHMAAGTIAQRICVFGAAHGLTVRPSDAYSVELVQQMVQAERRSTKPLFQLVIGWETQDAGAASRYRQTIRF